ncbi:MAG: tetratricopeptide repeat protein [Candidatus Hydrogenedentes bacterium]|nr:tetratricopeptide repeat protein [Candidatus Hydrogenedentota bacterium]
MNENQSGRGRTEAWIAVGLALATLAVFWGVGANGFVNYDDPVYVTENADVLGGLSGAAIVAAFTKTYNAGWNPLVMVSHAGAVELFGLNARGHHFVDLALHVANVLLLFFVLRGMTGATWPSALVAALFAIHPLHVQPVAWVSSRKDTLSTLWWFLAMGAYGWYAARPNARRYAALLVCVLLGLLTKPMLVTLPCALFLLDYWPLRRLRFREEGGEPVARLVLEKVPLFALAAGVSLVTYFAQRGGGAVRDLAEFPLRVRAGNAAISYVAYIVQTAWPARLSVYYPHPGDALSMGQAGLAALAVTGVTVAAVWAGRRRPYLATGWLWYLGTLVPVIGLIQIGSFARADRFTYVPHVGLFIVVAWGLADLVRGRPRAVRGVVTALVLFAIVALGLCSRGHVAVWRDSVSLFEHAVRVTEENAVARNNLAVALMHRGRFADAEPHLAEALRLRPEYVDAYNNLGIALANLGRMDDAMAAYRRALALDPGNVDGHVNLGNAFAGQGEDEEAVAEYRKALDAAPGHVAANYNLGLALARQGDWAGSTACLGAAVRARPDHADAHYYLGEALLVQGRPEEAAAHLMQAAALRPGHADTHYNLGVALAQLGDFSGAARHFEETLRIDPAYELARKNLDALKAGAGQP